MEKNVIKSLIIEYQQFVEKITLIERDIHLSDQLNYVFVGLRRAGKSYLMYQHTTFVERRTLNRRNSLFQF